MKCDVSVSAEQIEIITIWYLFFSVFETCNVHKNIEEEKIILVHDCSAFLFLPLPNAKKIRRINIST